MSDNSAEDKSVDKTVDWLLEEYRLYVEMADKVSARRIEASRLYIALLTGLLAVIPFILEQGTPASIQKTVLISMGFLGLALCCIWTLNIRSYSQLNSLKFRVIHEIEQRLPFPCYEREWEILKEQHDSRSYLRLSKVERYIPVLLMIPYLVLLIYAFFFS